MTNMMMTNSTSLSLGELQLQSRGYRYAGNEPRWVPSQKPVAECVGAGGIDGTPSA